MNANTQCNELAERARNYACALVLCRNRRCYGYRSLSASIRRMADAIIAERTRELAANLRAQMPEPGYNMDGTRQTVTYDGLTRDEWIARELGVTVREVTP